MLRRFCRWLAMKWYRPELHVKVLKYGLYEECFNTQMRIDIAIVHYNLIMNRDKPENLHWKSNNPTWRMAQLLKEQL